MRAVTWVGILVLAVLPAITQEACAQEVPLATYGRHSIGGTSRTLPQISAKQAVTCPAVVPPNVYRFVEGVDPCPVQMNAAALAQLQDPFARTVLKAGTAVPPSSPASIVDIQAAVANDPAFAQLKSYMVGEGSQIPAAVVSRDASRNLRYVLAWGATSDSTVFLSAAPAGTHLGRPAPFLQVIGYDAARKLFNFYQFLGSPGSPQTRSWMWSGDSSFAHDSRLSGGACQLCHINGALNMKELTAPWNNWQSPQATISALNIPRAVALDPLYQTLSGADVFESSFEGLQSAFVSNFVASRISGGKISGVPELLSRLITNSTVNFAAVPPNSADPSHIAFPPGFFLSDVLTSDLGISGLPNLKIPADWHSAFITAHTFALQQQHDGKLLYQQPGTTFFPLFVPVASFEDRAAVQSMLNLNVIDSGFAASILMVDFPNPVFSAKRQSLMKYAAVISSAEILPSPVNGIPAQFAALVTAAARNQPACDPASLLSCTAEQQFLFFYEGDWKKNASAAVSAYGSALQAHTLTEPGAADYLTLAVSRQSQFSTAPVISNLDEFTLFFPCSDIQFKACQRMNADGSVSDDPDWRAACPAPACASAN